MKTTHRYYYLVLALSVAAAVGLSGCNKNENASPDNGEPPAAMSAAKPAMPPVTEPPAMGASAAMPAQPATTSSAGTH